MTSFETWSVFAITEVALCLTPGPAVLFVVSQGLRYGGPRSLFANAGILAGNGIYFALSASGLGAILLASHKLFLAIKWAGAAYLLVLGIRSFFDRQSRTEEAAQFSDDSAASRSRLFTRGLATQLGNPKALIFFSALLPQFINSSLPLLPQILLLGITGEVIEFLTLSGYGLLAGNAGSFLRQPRFAAITNRVSGTFLIAAGAGLAFVKTE